MEPQDHSVRHFEKMIQLGKSLNALPAQLVEHGYSCESFGSWWSIIHFRGVRLRVIFDGRDGDLRVERSSTNRAPDVWQSFAAHALGADEIDALERDVVDLVQKAADAHTKGG